MDESLITLIFLMNITNRLEKLGFTLTKAQVREKFEAYILHCVNSVSQTTNDIANTIIAVDSYADGLSDDVLKAVAST